MSRAEWVDWGKDDYVSESPPVMSILLGTVTICLGILALILLIGML